MSNSFALLSVVEQAHGCIKGVKSQDELRRRLNSVGFRTEDIAIGSFTFENRVVGTVFIPWVAVRGPDGKMLRV